MFPYFIFFGKIDISMQLCFPMFIQTLLVLWRGREQTFNSWFNFLVVKVELLFLFLLGIVLMNHIYLGLLIIFIVTILSSFFTFITFVVMTPFSFLILFVHAESLKKVFAKCVFYSLFFQRINWSEHCAHPTSPPDSLGPCPQVTDPLFPCIHRD